MTTVANNILRFTWYLLRLKKQIWLPYLPISLQSHKENVDYMWWYINVMNLTVIIILYHINVSKAHVYPLNTHHFYPSIISLWNHQNQGEGMTKSIQVFPKRYIIYNKEKKQKHSVLFSHPTLHHILSISAGTCFVLPLLKYYP